MAKTISNTVTIAGKPRLLNARPDTPDLRDRWYEPALIQLKRTIDNRFPGLVDDQGREGACTGFGLAAVINILNQKRKNTRFKASPRMLYEMAKKHDEWPGEAYAGSSCRGAIRGWKNMGVCSAKDWPYSLSKADTLTIERAISARENTLGAYYRLRPEINDYHAALNEVDAIYVSADVHEGWWSPKAQRVTGKANQEALAVIKPSLDKTGGHAFAIVGYNADGFIVQNSWSKRWGSSGFALWLYEDWFENIYDGWVFRLAVPTPQVFGMTARTIKEETAEIGKAAPKRLEIAGHFVHFDDGRFKEKGSYWSTAEDVQFTAERIRDSVGKYQHLMIYAHGGLNSPKASATRIAALRDGFKRNGIYPFHIMYDTGVAEEIKDAVLRAYRSRRARGFFKDMRERITEVTDNLIEDLVRKPVTPLWDEMKRDACLPFSQQGGEPGDGAEVIRIFARTLADSGMKIHLAGHSTGGVLLGYLMKALAEDEVLDTIASCSLMAPACSTEFYQEHYAPHLGAAPAQGPRIAKLDIYNLNSELELADNVVAIYRKSLLYLVSRALERPSKKVRPLLGMERYSKKLKSHADLKIHYSNGKTGITTSRSHGGFDNDAKTLNAIMKRILGENPPMPFDQREMKGY